RGRRLAHRSALLADEKDHELARGMGVHAGDECVAALDAMHEPVLAQELKRPVDGDRRGPRAFGSKPVHDLVGAEGTVADQERRQHVAPDRREPLAALDATVLCCRHSVRRTAIVIVAWRRENRSCALLARWSGLGHRQTLPARNGIGYYCNAAICYCIA